MQMAEYNSIKYLNCSNVDPLLPIYRQLKEQNAEVGNYFRIVDRELKFEPIYKITSLIESNLPLKADGIKKSAAFRDERDDNNLIQNKLEHQSHDKIRFAFGSQIYLKKSRLQYPKIEIIKPYFSQLYVWLHIKDKGYLFSNGEKITYCVNAQKECIWLCTQTLNEGQNVGTKQVIFGNFEDNSYLYLDQSGVFMICSEERATRFTLRRIGISSSFIIQGRNSLSLIVRNKSKDEIKKIIDRNIEKNDGKKMLETQLQILPVEDSYITIQLELNYSKKALQAEPSINLIKTILDELIYYGIMDFLRDSSLINEHLQQLLIQYDIFQSIASYLTSLCQISKKQQIRFQDITLRLPKKSLQSKRISSKMEQEDLSIQSIYGNELSRNDEMREILKTIGLLARQNVKISKIFLPLLREMMLSQLLELAQLLISENQFFQAQFHRSGWYSQLYKNITRCSKKQLLRKTSIFCKFCEGEQYISPIITDLYYKQLPSTNNQYLIYHSVKTGDYHAKIFQFEIYSEGSYVFLHDCKLGKDTEFLTFIEGLRQQQSEKEINRQTSKKQIIPQIFNDQDNRLVIAQINFIKAVCDNYNYNLILLYWPIAYALAPYCYQENFPQLSNQDVKKAILQLIFAIERTTRESLVFSRSLVSFTVFQGDQAKVAMMDEVGDFKSNFNLFMKNYRKKSQVSRKILRQMGEHFMKKTKDWSQQIKRKNIHITDVYEKNQDENLVQWLNIMTVYLSLRLTKVKEKKEGQLLNYIKKFFQGIQKEKKNSNQSQGNLLNFFIQFLLQLLNYNSKNDRYLLHIKAKKNYEGKFGDQLNKVFGNLQGKKEVSFIRKNKGFTKIQLIDFVYKGLQKQKIKDSMGTWKLFNQNEVYKIKNLAAKLIQQVLMNINQEMVDQSVQTLKYLVKNPNDLSNVSRFGLLQMLPKIPFEGYMKRIVLQSWYLSSNSQLFNLLTNILRLTYQKKIIFRQSLNDVFLCDKLQLLSIYQNMIYPAKFIRKLSVSCQTWLRGALMQKYGDVYEAFSRNFSILTQCLTKIRSTGESETVSKIIQNLQIFKSIEALLQYMSDFYLEVQANNNIDSKIFNINAENPFIEHNLNQIVAQCLSILDLYMNNRSGIKFRQTKIVLFALGPILSEVAIYNPILLKTFNRAKDLSRHHLLQLMRSISPTMIQNMCCNLPKSWPFIDVYRYLQNEHLIRYSDMLFNIGWKKQPHQVRYLSQQALLSYCTPRSQFQQVLYKLIDYHEQQNDYIHQLAWMKLIYKLVVKKINIQIVQWFRDHVFWQIVQRHSESKYQKHYRKVELCQLQIVRRRLICVLAYQFRVNHLNNDSRSGNISEHHTGFSRSKIKITSIEEEEVSRVLQNDDILISDFINQEIKQSKQKLLLPFGHQTVLALDNIKESLRFIYMEYIVCDLTILSREVSLLKEQNIRSYLRQCRQLLKELSLLRVIGKEDQSTQLALIKIEKLLVSNNYLEEPFTMRKINLIELNEQVQMDEQSPNKSKPVKKWEKALNQLNNQKFFKKMPELIDDMIQLDDIYQFKSQSENIQLVVNHEDLFFKLVESSLNMKRLSLTQQNQIFIMEQIFMVAKRKMKSKKDSCFQQVRQYSIRLLESIVEQENALIADRDDFGRWNTNVYCISIKMQIISISKLFQLHKQRTMYYHYLTTLLRISINNYETDCSFLELYKLTLHSKEENNLYDCIIPFDIIFNIITSQITLQNIQLSYQREFSEEIVRAFLVLNTDFQCRFRKYNSSDLLKAVDKIEKGLNINIIADLTKNSFYQQLLNIKK